MCHTFLTAVLLAYVNKQTFKELFCIIVGCLFGLNVLLTIIIMKLMHGSECYLMLVAANFNLLLREVKIVSSL